MVKHTLFNETVSSMYLRMKLDLVLFPSLSSVGMNAALYEYKPGTPLVPFDRQLFVDNSNRRTA